MGARGDGSGCMVVVGECMHAVMVVGGCMYVYFRACMRVCVHKPVHVELVWDSA